MKNDICIIEKFKNVYDEKKLIGYFSKVPYTAVLDSSLKSETLGRYTIVAFEPYLTFESKYNEVLIKTKSECKKITDKPLEVLRVLLKSSKISIKNNEVPFAGGCIGYFSYDLANQIEDIIQKNIDHVNIPDIELGFYNKVIVIDYLEDEIYICASSCGNENDKELIAKNNIINIKNHLSQINCVNTNTTDENISCSDKKNDTIKSNFSKHEYEMMVDSAREYIRNGDIFQVNVSQRFEKTINRSPEELYINFRSLSPAPFCAYLNFEGAKILSSSPERFLKIHNRIIETRPIKGTRPRGKTPDEDEIFKNELRNSQKDNAELTMIVDLSRNDLGRVCKIGSVIVEKHADIEGYANVFHSVSTIKGELKDDVDIIDCIYAAFPGGSITGAPKIRAMEIIEELEPVKRNIYTGSIGYIGFDGSCDLNIAIRTVIVKDNKAYYSVGGGIVWDSDPEKEYYETMHKGSMMMRLLEEMK